MKLDANKLNRIQLEILFGMVQPFQAWRDETNDMWWVVPESGPPGTGDTFLAAVLNAAESHRPEDDGPDEGGRE